MIDIDGNRNSPTPLYLIVVQPLLLISEKGKIKNKYKIFS